MICCFSDRHFCFFPLTWLGSSWQLPSPSESLGFSPVVRHKRGVLTVLLFAAMISVPLYLAYNNIVDQTRFERSWQKERFLVNGKYLIVRKATLTKMHKNKVLMVEIHAREPLDRFDLNEFRRKVHQHYADDLEIRAQLIYIP